MAGKEVLIKVVTQSVPSYVLNLFLLLKGVCRDIEIMFNRFWWRNKVVRAFIGRSRGDCVLVRVMEGWVFEV